MANFGIAVPHQFPLDGSVDLAELRRCLEELDRAQLHSVWVMESIVGPVPQLEPLGMLTYAAAFTSSVRLGVGVALLPLRSPVQFAKALATLDHLSNGRLIVGVGVGSDSANFAAFGTTQRERVERFEGSLRVMRQLWSDESVTASGLGWSLDAVSMLPKPVQDPLPVWIGAHAEPALRRAVEQSDGFMGAGMATTSEFAEQVEFVRTELAGQAGDVRPFPISKRVYLAIDDDAARARQLTHDWFQRLYGDGPRAAHSAAAGPVDACVEWIVDVIDAGAELVVLNPVAEGGNEANQIRRLIEEVVPAVQKERS